MEAYEKDDLTPIYPIAIGDRVVYYPTHPKTPIKHPQIGTIITTFRDCDTGKWNDYYGIELDEDTVVPSVINVPDFGEAGWSSVLSSNKSKRRVLAHARQLRLAPDRKYGASMVFRAISSLFSGSDPYDHCPKVTRAGDQEQPVTLIDENKDSVPFKIPLFRFKEKRLTDIGISLPPYIRKHLCIPVYEERPWYNKFALGDEVCLVHEPNSDIYSIHWTADQLGTKLHIGTVVETDGPVKGEVLVYFTNSNDDLGDGWQLPNKQIRARSKFYKAQGDGTDFLIWVPEHCLDFVTEVPMNYRKAPDVPVYEFICPKCNKRFEEFFAIAGEEQEKRSRDILVCSGTAQDPHPKTRLEKVFSQISKPIIH